MRQTVGAVVLVGAVALLAACGGDGESPTTSSSTSSSSSTTSSTSTTATPSTTTTTTAAPTKASPPLSRFENDARVKAARKWVYEFGKAVNANDKSYEPWLATMSDKAVKNRGNYIDEDLGLSYPGPAPFTPVKVKKSSVDVCIQLQGWALNPKTKQPARPRQVSATTIELVQSKNGWIVDSMYLAKFSCAKTKVVGRAW